MAWIWGQLLVCAAAIGIAGSALSRYGDVIAEKTGWGATWIGLVLVASVTSLPELITGASSVALAGVPDIALGDVLGSCVFNLALIVLLDLLHRGESVYTRASHGQVLAAGFGVILLGAIGLTTLLAGRGGEFAIGHVGLYSPIIVLLYAIAMRLLFRFEQKQMAEFAGKRVERYAGESLRRALAIYAGAAVVVVAAGSRLPFVGEQLAQAMGWNQTFVGTLFIAVATSLPEVAVTLSALRIGAVDIAISNLFGSNLFNCLIVAIDDLLYTRGPILEHVSPLHAVSALSAIMMSGVAVVALLYRPAGRVLKTVGWASVLLLTIFLLNTMLLFSAGR